MGLTTLTTLFFAFFFALCFDVGARRKKEWEWRPKQ
jgi:hypothetical protein